MKLPSLRIQSTSASLFAGASLALAWLLPSTIASAILGWIFAACLFWCVKTNERRYLKTYAIGLISHVIAFYWLYHTIQYFGGFPAIAAIPIFLLFISISSLQYVLFQFIFNNLPTVVDTIGMRLAISWVASEAISIRIFPWHLGHTQIAFSPFVQIADLGGAMIVSFMMLWLIESLIRLVVFHDNSKALAYSLLTFCVVLCYGVLRLDQFGAETGTPQSVAIIQGNVSLEEKHDAKYFVTNKKRYEELSRPFVDGSTLIVWPESVIQDWIPANVDNIMNDKNLPASLMHAPMLLGALTYLPPDQQFNSAVAIEPDGKIPAPYHKRILMPFGEYMPFASYIPGLQKLKGDFAEFTAGKTPTVFNYELEDKAGTPYRLRVSPLICYEDIVPSLSREATQRGAELLVNITNDAWFGNSIAPWQHHLIASFRAIENRRYLVRATNTGISAVVSPTGKTLVELPGFSEQTLLAQTELLSYKSPYTVYFGDLPWLILGLLALLGSAYAAIKRRNKKTNVLI